MFERQNMTRLLLVIDFMALITSFIIGQSVRLNDFNGSLSLWWQDEGQFRMSGLLDRKSVV